MSLDKICKLLPILVARIQKTEKMILLSDEQKHVIKDVVSKIKTKPYFSIGGYAGTGKTTVINVLAKKFSNFAVCAFTGKATSVLRKKGVTNASTIHGLIYAPEKDIHGVMTWHRVYDVNCTGFIIDESSWISKEIHEDLLSYGKPIIYVGDHGQLESVSGTKFNVLDKPDYKLEKIHRNAGEIAYFAEHLRKGNFPETFKCQKQVQVVKYGSVLDRHLLQTDQILCGFNKTRVAINQRIRRYKGIDLTYITKDEKIMCLKNNQKLGLFNGLQGIVTKVHKGDKLSFVADGIHYHKIPYDLDQFGKEKNEFDYGAEAVPFDYAYGMTGHKSQGDEWGNGIVFEEPCDLWDPRRHNYVTSSRFKQGLVWVAAERYIPSYLS